MLTETPTPVRHDSKEPLLQEKHDVKLQQSYTKDIHNDCYSTEDLTTILERLEGEAAIQRKRDERAECVQLTADLVEMFGNRFVLRILQQSYSGPLTFQNWHHDLRYYVSLSYVSHLRKETKKAIYDLMNKMDRIAEDYGISKDQWADLVYLNVTTNTHESTSIDNDQLNYIDELARNSTLNIKLRNAVHALVKTFRSKRTTLYRNHKRQ